MAYGYKIKKEEKDWKLNPVPFMEWTPRRGRRKSRARIRQQERQQMLLSLTMATGFLAYPYGISEAAIVPKDSADSTKITVNGNVYTISPQGTNGDFAYNRFKEFGLADGQIANLLFGNTSTLANLVHDKITINGIVNAVRNSNTTNSIDGHLMFLSPNGIVVGASGVINAGQFTGIVPTQTDFDKLYNATDSTSITLDAINGLSSYANDKTIDISGQINTHSGVMLGAGIINIQDGSKIQSTKGLNFADLVNIQSGASAGLGSLSAVEGSGGDIILTARQISDVKDTKTENNAQTPNPIRWRDRSTDLSAAVNIGKDSAEKGVSITSSDGAVKLTAESKSTYEDSTPMTLTNTLKDVILGSEETIVDGLINKLAGKEAEANKYLFANYSNKKNKSAVKIGEKSEISGKRIDIAANSTVEIKQSLAVPGGDGKKDSNGNTKTNDSVMPVAAVAISRVYNNADVVIDGKLTAAGADAEGSGIKIAANADTKAKLSAAASGGEKTSAAVGVAVLSGDTTAKVTVNAPANVAALTATQGKVSIESVTNSDIDVNVNAVGTKSYVVSNVGVANYDTSADVVMERSITAGAVDIKAENNITRLKMTVDNTAQESSGGSQGKDTSESTPEQKTQDDNDATTEKNKPASGKTEGEKNSEKKSLDPTKVLKDSSVDTTNNTTQNNTKSQDAQTGVQNVKDKVEGTNEGGNNAKKTTAFGLGAAVGVVSNQNDANVSLGKNAVINASKVENSETLDSAVNVVANTLMTASKEAEDSLQFSVKNTMGNAKVEIGAAVLVSNVKNNAKILLDNEGEKSAQIKGDGETSLIAAAGMGTYKADQKKKDENGNELNETEEVDKNSTLTYAVSAENASGKETPTTFALGGSVGINTLKDNAVVLLGQKSKVDGSAIKLSANAATNAAGKYGTKDENNKVGIGATVGLQNISGNSLVMAGKGVEVTGTESVKAKAANTMDLKNNVQNAGKGDSFGVSGMVALSYGDSNNIVSLDDEAVIQGPSVSLEAENSTNVDNSARSESEGSESSKAFGIGVGIINYDVNSIAMVGDNGSGITAPTGNTTDVEKAAQKIYKDGALAREIAGSTLAGKLGVKTTGNAKGSIITGDLSVSALTTGMIKNDAKAKAVSSTKEDKSENANERTDSQRWTQWSSQGTQGANEARNNTENLEQDNVTSQNESAAPNASGAGQEAGSAANPDETPTAPTDNAAPAAGSEGSAGASIGMEGSVALTFLGGRTDAVLDNVTVKSGAADSDLVDSVSAAVSATDLLGSITLGGTNNKHSLKAGSSATKVGIGGTFAMNSENRDVDSLVRNSTLEKVGYLSNSAAKIGLEVAAGMGVSSAKGNGTNISGAGVVYYNKAKQDVHALLINNTVTSDFLGNVLGLGMLTNEATSTDFQIAGGLAANLTSGSNTNVGVGGAVAISQLENNLSSGIIGGSYENFATIDVNAQKGTTQINGAAAGGKSGYGFNGAFAYGSVKNETNAYISDAEVGGILTGAVNVRAGEVPVVKSQDTLDNENTELNDKKTEVDGKEKLTENAKTRLKESLEKGTKESENNAKKGAENKKLLEDSGVDTTGKVYLLDGDETSTLDDDVKDTDEGKIVKDAAGEENDAKGLLGQNHSLTITAAMAGGLVTGEGSVAGSAGIAYNYVKNDIAADIRNSIITADSVSGEASSDSLIVSVGAGVAVGGKAFNGAGSGSWNDLKNDTKVTFADNTIRGNKISEAAVNDASIINIAGEVAGGKGMAMGLSLAYNSLNNTTGTYLTGNDIDTENLNSLLGGENSVKLSTVNKGKTLAVAGGVDVNISQSVVGAVGTVAINRGVSNTESIIDGKKEGGTVTNTTLDDIKSLSVTAEELTKKTTVAGGISVGGKKVGIGGAVAYTAIGSSGSADKKEKLRAEINHADITTTADGTIEVSTKDSQTEGTETNKSRITTVGAGLGVEWGSNLFNLQGAAAVSDIYKDSRASLNNTNINKDNADAHPAIEVVADTKSKINTVGAVGNVSVSGKVTGTVGLAINRMDLDTKAEMATDDGKTTKVNAGLTKVRAIGDGDIHSVGVGGTVSVGEFVTAAGSGSYNYIGNDVDAIIKNQNVISNSSVGVVAQGDDRLYNFAGGFNIGINTRAALGTSVSTNKISGNTNALVSGGSLVAADTGAIEVTRPQDANLFNVDSLDLTTDRQRLSANRQSESKTGIVVDSSATHTIISQLASGGVAASSTIGLNLAGTVNINTIKGETTAKIQDADLNSADQYSHVNVNAVDYTNFGSFTGTPAIGAGAALGVSLGVSANWETYDRTTESEISSTSINAKKNVYAKNLTVDATAKHGSSALSFAAAAGGGKVGVASGDSIMRHTNTSTVGAKLDKVNAVFDGKAEVKAEHLGNSHTQNIAASVAAGMAAVAAGAGVSVIDDTSTVKAEVSNSSLKAKSSEDGRDIAVLAKNENNWKNTLVTASLGAGIGAGLAANVGIYNTTGETAAVVNKSELEAANVNVNATDKLTAHATGGVGAGGVGGVGVAVALNNINSSVSAHVAGGSVKAAKDIDVKAEEVRDFDSSVTGASAGGLGVGVNVAVTSINKGITDAQLSNAADENGKTGVNATTQNEILTHLNSVNNAKGVLGDSQAKFYGMNAEGRNDLEAARNVKVDLSTPKLEEPKDDAVYTKRQGVHTEISQNASLLAGNNVNVTAKDTSDIFARNIGVTAAGTASVNVTDAIIHTNYDTDVSISSAAIEGRNVAVNALQTQAGNGSEVKVTAVTVGALGGVGVGYAGIVNKGAADVNIANSTIKATGSEKNDKGITVNAKDESKHKAEILSVGVAALNVTTTFASVENKSNVGAALGGTNNISAAKDITIDAKKANTLNAHTQGVGVGGVNVAVNHATIEDEGTAAAKITGTDGSFTAKSFHLGAANDTTAKLSAGNTAVSVLGVSRMRGKGVMTMGAEVDVAGGIFNAGTVEFVSQLGTANGRTLEGNVKGHNISAVAVAPDAVILNTEATSKVNVKNSSFAEDTDLILDNESYVDRKAYIYGVTAGVVAVGNTSADISGKETMESTLMGKEEVTKLNSLQVLTYGENKGKAFADAGGGGLVGYVGAHVDNKSTNNLTSTLGGKWEAAGDVYLMAAQADEVRLTASEGHGGVAGVGGTSVDNTITTTTKDVIADNTEITSDRIHVGTDNTVTTGAYDDTDSKGNKDVQTYTLKDHFGGVISGNRLRSLLDLTETGVINIGKNAKITTNNLQEYVASSQNNLTNLVQAKGGGAIVVTDAVSELDIDVNNKVNVDTGAVLSNEKSASTEDIVLAAYDNQTLKSHVDGTVYAGVVSPIVAKNNIDMNRRSDVTVAGTIESGSNVGLYAGANKAGVLSNLNVDLKSGAYNYSVIPVTVPRVTYDLTADKGTVNVSGDVHSTRDINVIASGGKEEIVKDESLWNWAKGGSSTDKKFLTSDAATGTESDAEMRKSTVNVTGALIAGTSAPINITIHGSVAGGLEYTADDNVPNQRVLQGITQGTFDYANTLGDRLRELEKLIAAYNGDSSKMAAYIAERGRIQSEMERLGLVEKDDNGNIVQYLNSGRSVYYVEIPDIATSGGNINVTANDFIGTGKLHANSAPSITIENKSDAYLKLNNILMGEQGGSIVYNGFGAHLQGTVIPPSVADGNKKINEMNRNEDGTKWAEFSEIYGVTDNRAAGLSVQNTKTFSGDKTSTLVLTPQLEQEIESSDMTADEKAEAKQAIRDGKMKYTALTDVEVNGKISNFYGNVTINNLSGDIRISGGTKDRPAGVKGNTVTLTAANGTIAQDYKEGIVNINGDPEKYLAEKAAEMKNTLGMSTVNNDAKDKTESYQRSESSNAATGYIAGRDIYVSAANVNVNGLIQSGYKKYEATVTETQLTVAKQRPATRAAVIQNRTMYKVNDGGAKWNDTDKVFDYVPQVYWDPSTNKLVVEDIDTQGGKVYLTGKIASTGDGRIMAADGAAEISVINETSLDMNVGNVLNNQREGVITIADTAKDTWTEYKKGQTRTIANYADYLKNHAGDSDIYAGAAVNSNNGLSIGNNLTYAVKDNQTYTWINGKSIETTRTYEHYVRKGMWGLVKTADENELKSWAQSSTPIDTSTAKELGLPEGAVIMQDSSNVPESGKLRLDGQTQKLEERTFGHDHWVTRSGFLGWFKHIHDRWKVGTSTIQLYNYTLNASQPIEIGLLGAEKGSIDIKSTNVNGGSINLTGNVANSHNLAELNVSSKAGGIFQNDGTTLKSEIVNLTAKDDIKNIHITSVGAKDGSNVSDNIKLSAISTGKGDIDITAMGGLLNNQSLPGNVEIVALKSQNGNAAFKNDAALGDVTLNAAGNITQPDNSVRVEGRAINLTSNNGGIGKAEQAIQLVASDLAYATDRYGAQVNASAKGSIYLTEAAAGGNMRVGRIESREGDVTLTVANGGFIDALPSDDKSGSVDSVDEMVHRWIDAGVIDGEKDAQGSYTYKGVYIEGLEKARDDYKANIEAVYDVQNGGKTQEQWSADYQAYRNSYDDYVANREKYANYENLSPEERQELDANNPGGYANYKQFSAQKAAYDSYLANKERFANLSVSEREALEANGDSDYKAYQYYSQFGNATADEYLQTNTVSYKYSQYADANAYLEADAKYQDLVTRAANPTFEWTKDMMLYAVSDKLVNPDGGSSNQTDRAANVLGRNVTLSAAKGAVGTFTDQSATITVDELTGNNSIAKMKELMNVDAADVTAHRDANGNLLSFEIKGNMPLGVKASGTLNVQAGGNISVAGRKDADGENSAINVGTIDATKNSATGDVRLHSDKGIYNANNADDANITGKNLILTGGKESIGTADKPLAVSLSGDLTEARADKNVFIKNVNNEDFLRLGALYAGDTLSLDSEKGFTMSNANEDIAASYINAGKTLVFQTNAATGMVGEADNAIRILNDRAPVNIAAKSAYIRGMGSLALGIQNGTLVLGNIDTKDVFIAESDGSIAVGQEEEKNSGGTVVKPRVAGAIKTGGIATLSAADDLTLNGTVTAGDLENAKTTLSLKAGSGSITQTAKGAITADKVETINEKSLLLENENNRFNTITVDSGSTANIAGDVKIKDNADGLTVKINQNVAGDISVQNLRENGTLTNAENFTATGKIALSANGNLTQAANTVLTAGKDVELTSVNAGIKQNANTGILAQTVITTSAQGVDLQGEGNQFEVLAVHGTNANAPLQGSVSVLDNADKLELSVQLVVNGDIAAENQKANGVLQVGSELQTTGNGADVKGNIVLKSDGSLQTDKKLTAANNVQLTSAMGDVAINGDVSTSWGQIPEINDETLALEGEYNSLTIRAGGAIREAAGVVIDTPVVETYSGKDVSLESKNNLFSTFLAEALPGSESINGSVKAATSYFKNKEEDTFTIGLGASIQGDAEFTNHHKEGDLGLLIWNPEDESEKIQVLGGNGAKGTLSLKAGKDVAILGDANAAHDIVIDCVGGSLYGLGKGMAAGNDVRVTAGDAVYYIGTINAVNDIDIQVKALNANPEDNGIYIGVIPDGENRQTLLEAGHEAHFQVGGDGNLQLYGDIVAQKDVAANISGTGNILIDDAVISKEESVSVQTNEGHIFIGTDKNPDEETIKAKKNVMVGTNLGVIYILGKTITQNGDISMKAGQETYEEGAEHGNFIIRDDGQLLSGGGIGLYGRNGDIHITDDLQAPKGISVHIAEQGNIFFDRDVSVTNNVDISTDKGNITVGHIVNSDEETVRLKAETGDILVGKDITAGKDIAILSKQGNIVVGDTTTGDDGDVLAKAGNVLIQTGTGNVGIVKTVTAQAGSIGIASGQGDILIGNNGPDVKTVTARDNIALTAEDGKIVVYGKTSTENGDISLTAHRENYLAGEENSSFIIDQNGKLEAGRALSLNVGNGDLHVSDRIQSKEDLATGVVGKGSVYFDTDVDVDGKVTVKADEGDIYIGHDVQSKGDIAMTVNTGTIQVGAAVNAASGNVNLATKQGDIDIGKEVRAETGSIGIQTGTGSVTIGNNGPDVETVTAQESINVGVNVGQVKIYGKTSTKAGDIAMSAGADQYTPGIQNFIIEQNGLLESGQDIYLTGRNGDLRVTDAIQAKRDLYAKVLEEGSVSFDKTVTLRGNVEVNTDAGQIAIEGQVDASSVDLSTQQGNIAVGGKIASETLVNLNVGTGNITVQSIEAGGDVNMAVQNGDIQMHDVTSAGDVTVLNSGSGSITGNDIVAAGITHVELTHGDLFLNLAEGKAVLLRMEDNTEASRVNKILAEASGDSSADVTMTGNFIQIGSLAARSDDAVFQLSATGAGNERLIAGDFTVESLSSKHGTQLPQLWTNRGYVHVDEGDFALQDVLAKDKIHLDNAQTDLAIYGRIPTKDGEQLVYWNNLGMAYSKERAFNLYTNGRLRTSWAVLVDANRNYGKLYGDNLSVVDMMRERLTNTKGKFTFDSARLTDPSKALREWSWLDIAPMSNAIGQQNAGKGEIIVENEGV